MKNAIIWTLNRFPVTIGVLIGLAVILSVSSILTIFIPD